ncbi:MAG: nucleotide exchange factor GrpE [Betaproteobacteria bacterium]|nr:nucleotide exchange factor GrpE [Betaproteobacteria bacterium]
MSTPHDQSNPLNPEASPADDNASSAETIPSLEESLRQAELLAQEHHDAWLRARAESDNIRKRAQQDIANAHKYAIENFATELLAVKDSLEAALNDSSSDRNTLQEGVALTLKQLSIAFEKAKLLEINPVGDKFDPHKHQAISMLVSEAEPNTVITVLQKGYSLQERVIRPALVTVAKAG